MLEEQRRQLFLGWHDSALGEAAKKRLHFPSGQKRNQHSPWILFQVLPNVRHPSWSEQKIAWTEFELLIADLDVEGTSEGIKPFVLFEMQVAGRTKASQLALLNQ